MSLKKMKTRLFALVVAVLTLMVAIQPSQACNGICSISVGGKVSGSVGKIIARLYVDDPDVPIAVKNAAETIQKGAPIIPLASCDSECKQNNAEWALRCCTKSGVRANNALCVNGRAYCV